MDTKNATPATSSAPQSVTAEIRFHADRLGAHLSSNNERTHDAASHGLSVAEIAMALAEKAAALDALVEAAQALSEDVRKTYHDFARHADSEGTQVFVTAPRVAALETALTAAKAAQVSK